MSDNQNIHTAIHSIMQSVGYVQKRQGGGLGYSFAGESELIAALRPAMVENGVYCHVLELRNARSEPYLTGNGKPMQRTQLEIVMRFVHAPSGSFIDVMSAGEGADSGDKSQNKALTGAYKYGLRQTFCIETGDDPDQDAPQNGHARPVVAKAAVVAAKSIAPQTNAASVSPPKPTVTKQVADKAKGGGQGAMPIVEQPIVNNEAQLYIVANQMTKDHYQNVFQMRNALGLKVKIEGDPATMQKYLNALVDRAADKQAAV